MKSIEQIKDEMAIEHGWKNRHEIDEAYKHNSISQYSFDDYIEDVAKVYAKQFAVSLPVFRICKHCNTEFELPMVNGYSERVAAFQNCTHCGKRNDTWISIRQKS